MYIWVVQPVINIIPFCHCFLIESFQQLWCHLSPFVGLRPEESRNGHRQIVQNHLVVQIPSLRSKQALN